MQRYKVWHRKEKIVFDEKTAEQDEHYNRDPRKKKSINDVLGFTIETEREFKDEVKPTLNTKIIYMKFNVYVNQAKNIQHKKDTNITWLELKLKYLKKERENKYTEVENTMSIKK